jgi:hypothetical protein
MSNNNEPSKLNANINSTMGTLKQAVGDGLSATGGSITASHQRYTNISLIFLILC